jgi:hypothetical protein
MNLAKRMPRKKERKKERKKKQKTPFFLGTYRK